MVCTCTCHVFHYGCPFKVRKDVQQNKIDTLDIVNSYKENHAYCSKVQRDGTDTLDSGHKYKAYVWVYKVHISVHS